MPTWVNSSISRCTDPSIAQLLLKPAKGRWVCFAPTLLAVPLALLLMLGLNAWVPMSTAPFLLFYPAVLVSAWFGGLGAGLLTAVLSILAANYFFIPPLYTLEIAPLNAEFSLAVFVLSAIVMSYLSATHHKLLKALNQERDFSSAIISAAGSLIVVLDRQGRIVRFNQTCEWTTGYSYREVQGRYIWDFLLLPEEIELVQTVFHQLRAGITPEPHETNWLTKTGDRRRISWTSTSLLDEKGSVSYVIGTGVDVTEQHQVEAKLKEINQTLQALIQASPLSICVLDRQGRVKLWNPAAEKIFGWSQKEVLGHILPSIPQDKQFEFQSNMNATFQHEFQNGIEVRRKRKDGSTIYLNLWAAVLPGASREEDSILSVAADISDRKQAEDTLRKTQERLTSLFESDLIGILFNNIEGDIEDANNKFLQMIGYSREELEAGQLSWTNITPPEYATLDQEHLHQAQQYGSCTPYEKEYICKDGRRIPVFVGFTLVGQTQRQAVAFILDLTERQHLEQSLRRQTQELAQANRMKDEFLAVLSHELRTPLNSILGWAQLLQNRRFDPETTARALEIIERNARLQTQLIEDILHTARIIQGKLHLRPRMISLVPVIEAAIDAMRPAIDAKRVQMIWNFDPTVGEVYGDPERLQQVFWNLLSNAIKFTPEGGQVEIRLTKGRGSRIEDQQIQPADAAGPNTHLALLAKRQSAFHIYSSEYAQITVSDTGKGISSEFLPFVFDRFRQADSTTTRIDGGLGLGLAIVRHLIELHGGTVQAESQGLDQGSTFTIKLLLHELDDSNNQALNQFNTHQFNTDQFNTDQVSTDQVNAYLNAPTGPLGLSSTGKAPNGLFSTNRDPTQQLAGLRVLVVDDDLDTCQVLRNILEDSGATVTATQSVSDAMYFLTSALRSFAPTQKPDIIISDLGMPHEDGYALIRRLREIPIDGKTIPAIALTAYARETDQQRVLAEGFQMHLAKPIEPKQLVTAIAHLLGQIV